MNMARIKILCLIFFITVLFMCAGSAFARVGVNIVVVNPSNDKPQKVPVNYELPPGLQRSDILETGELEAEYDVARALFYVSGEVFLEPKETRVIKVTIKDIWNIPDEKFENIGNMLNAKIKSIQDKVDEDTLKLASEDLRSRLASVQRFQEENSADVLKRMGMYTANMEKLRRVENDIFSLDRTINKENEPSERDETVVLTIEASNPLDEERKLSVRYDLPRELTPQHIEEFGGMEIMPDATKGIFYLFSEEIFGPGETKRFQARIKNVWKIPESEVKAYVEEAVELNSKFSGVPGEETAAILLEAIKNNAARILESQNSAESVRDRVAVYRLNLQILQEIKDDLEKMKSLSIPEIDQEIAQGREALQDVLREEKLFSAIKELSDRLFKEKLTAATVWRIVLLIVSFAIILTVVFYAIWIVKVKKDETRSYSKME